MAIAKWIEDNYKLEPGIVTKGLRTAIRRMLEPDRGEPQLIPVTKGSFKLEPTWKEEWKKAQTRKKPKKKKSSTKKKTTTKGKKRTSTKKKKDPDAPKKALTAWILYFSGQRENIKKKNPELLFGELTKQASKQWRKLPDAKRKKYDDMAAADKKRYEREMKAYNKKKSMESSEEESSEEESKSRSKSDKSSKSSKSSK